MLWRESREDERDIILGLKAPEIQVAVVSGPAVVTMFLLVAAVSAAVVEPRLVVAEQVVVAEGRDKALN